ncbi:FGGY family carbohydrate kinase [Microbacterium sp. HD4P20]|uniref:FGGY family carbohydrate kinase n=1 Tax=Microbacterium sp. HD4P20 TaxID=2864874 RepID=UPI001C63DD43|nr:FGGY family carbohydrate kinase [Microbacterium sp. HD4P20]MCP2635552.1 FGGY family carbohydrate kinase [Microbacterium sp. HD4P20]
MTLVLGLDIGSTTTKAALVAVAAEVSVVRVARTPTPADAAELIAACAAVARECLADARQAIAAVGIASMAESGAVLGADGSPLTPLLRWDRHVDQQHLDDLLAQHPGLPSLTGVPATTKPAAIALRALRAEHPGLFGATRHWAGVADLVAHALTGVRATDHTLAARTMMAGADGDGWDAAVLASTGIALAALPDVRAPGEAVAPTTADALAFGLPAGVPVFIAGHDHAVGAWASGVRAPGAVADSLGTAEAIVRVTDAAATPAAVADGFSVGRTVDGSARTLVGGSRACGAMLEWWEAKHPADRLLSRLGALDPESWATSRMTVLPYPSGRQCPRPDPDARVAIRGEETDPAGRARAVLQGLVLHARWMRETIDAHAGSPSTDLTLLGSLADRIPPWAPLTGTAGIPAHRTTTGEPVAAGAALLAAVRVGAASPDLTLERTDVAPATAPGLDDAYRRFLDAALTEGER